MDRADSNALTMNSNFGKICEEKHVEEEEKEEDYESVKNTPAKWTQLVA